MMKQTQYVLFVNPWIHDFAAYDLFYRPLGLLYLAEAFMQEDIHVTLVDLLDRFHPQWADKFPHQRDKKGGTGFFYREKIEKPTVLRHIPRYFCRYGVPKSDALSFFQKLDPPPNAIFVTSHMTYWYTGVLETTRLLRTCFPNTPLILGGIYATLLPHHAKKVIQPDILVQGNDFTNLQPWLKKSFNFTLPPFGTYPLRKVWDHYPILKNFPLLTSVGCPYHCAFCAGPSLHPTFVQFPVDSIVEDVAFGHDKKGIKDFVFYDDALFVKKETHMKPLLRKILYQWNDLTFHTPNGLFARFIDKELAELMAKAHFYEPRVSLETVSENHAEWVSRKVSRKIYEKAIHHLHTVGYKPHEIITYILMGLPGQHPDEVLETVNVAFDAGSRVSLSAFSPVPHTPLWEKSKIKDLDDPLLQNNTVYWSMTNDYSAWDEIRLMVKEMNQKIKG
ncbi:MAG: radical SAM protein [Candidatus Marinimicrobia bacterium]|nr:radical SAM protein [Candidatus Neomarinimicrobiota bacterium]MDD5582646.1 radical SAM protein [Candidatus Neomarinimicrobiota bacterium]